MKATSTARIAVRRGKPGEISDRQHGIALRQAMAAARLSAD